jgi:hypothetical protein
MSVYGGPNIVTNGLVLNLDAGNSKSYPGSGTAWNDLSGQNRNGTLVNSPTYNANGSFTFNGTNQYASLTRPVQDDFTLSCWFQTNSTFGAAGSWWQGMGLVDGEVAGGANDFGLTIGAGKLMFGIGSPDQTLISPNSYNDGVWHYVVGTRNRSSGDVKLYADGNLVNSSTFTNVGSLTSPPNLTIGSLQTISSYYGGNISNVQVYNRVLTDNEVRQNFNALRGRYGV